MSRYAVLLLLILATGCGAKATADAPDYELVNMEEAAPDPTFPDIEYLLDPGRPPRQLAPATFQVQVDTTMGPFVLEIYREWSPAGVERFHHLVDIGYYTDIAVYRVIPRFVAQFGIHGRPEVNAAWKEATIKDDPENPAASNVAGTIAFVRTGRPNSRTVQLYINLVDNVQLDKMGFQAFGRVIEGMDVVRAINSEYGENRVSGFQQKFQDQGNDYVRDTYPNLDTIESMTIIRGDSP